jgi:lysophospholipase L1-like esterase
MYTLSERKPLYCIGDSHAEFFRGFNRIGPEYPHYDPYRRFPFLVPVRLGAVTAHNLNKLDSSSEGRKKLDQCLMQLSPPQRLLFCFGEIDIRCHLPKDPYLDFPLRIEKTVQNYIEVINALKTKGYEISVFAPIPSTLFSLSFGEHSTVGTCRQRNRITVAFNDLLKVQCEKFNIPYISIFDDLVGKDGLTKYTYYMDYIHLSQKAMPFALREIRKVYPDIPLPSFIDSFSLILDNLYQVNKLFSKSQIAFLAYKLIYLLSSNSKILSLLENLAQLTILEPYRKHLLDLIEAIAQ